MVLALIVAVVPRLSVPDFVATCRYRRVGAHSDGRGGDRADRGQRDGARQGAGARGKSPAYFEGSGSVGVVEGSQPGQIERLRGPLVAPPMIIAAPVTLSVAVAPVTVPVTPLATVRLPSV